MSSEKQTVTFRIDKSDPVLEALDDADNRSEFIRTALRDKARTTSLECGDLSDREQQAYEWLKKQAGGKWISLESGVKEDLAQKLSIKMSLVERQVLRELDKKGYIEHSQGFHVSKVYVRLPSEVGGDE